MKNYADSSFLVSCCLRDTHSGQSRDWLSGVARPLPITLLHELEIRSAMQFGIFRGHLSTDEATAAESNLDADLRARRLVRRRMNWEAVFRVAARLSKRNSALLGTRSLDVLHVASAKALRSRQFASFDERQRALASAVRLTLVP